ncbi:MAG TPA: SDR family NAD(P)-dependent oxidoreductase [Methylomirabilota bacterium]|nr:SDR family NAD(P)-dependent oxidoreductase [Methylomirabilota bacterium]
MTTFEGQSALITGASSGIGAALAREFARNGANVALAARRVERLARLAHEIEQTGRRAIAVHCDVTQDAEVEKAAAVTRDTFGRIDVVVANAGFGVVGPVERLTVDDYRRQFETNVFGVVRTVRATLEDVKRTRGRIVVMGSVAGHIAAPGSSPYAMSKFAVRAFAEALGHELVRAGVSVTLISPGYVASEIRRVDNDGTLREAASDPVPGWLIMPSARAARQIVQAVARRRREAVTTGHARAFVFLNRHAPWLVAAGIRRFGVKSRPEPRR